VITTCQIGVAVLAIMALRSIAAKTVLSEANADEAHEKSRCTFVRPL
jgi:hypothetical protein